MPPQRALGTFATIQTRRWYLESVTRETLTATSRNEQWIFAPSTKRLEPAASHRLQHGSGGESKHATQPELFGLAKWWLKGTKQAVRAGKRYAGKTCDGRPSNVLHGHLCPTPPQRVAGWCGGAVSVGLSALNACICMDMSRLVHGGWEPMDGRLCILFSICVSYSHGDLCTTRLRLLAMDLWGHPDMPETSLILQEGSRN